VDLAPPSPGPRRALVATPPAAPGSVRRTTSIDVTRPDGLLGPVVAVLTGRDREVDAEGGAAVLAEVALTVRVAVSGDVEGIDGHGPPGLGELVGAGLRSGFGRRAAATHDLLAAEGRIAVPSGPPAPVLEAADPDGWHGLPAPGEGTVRRRRLLEVARANGAGLDARAHFRDSWFGDGGEFALHEYSIEAAVDAGGHISRVEVDARVLPWDACPGAVASASRMVGVAVADLPARVRAELVGPSTCTHLNSMLRSLAYLSALRPGRG
jgi:hypothetical protein